MTTYNVIKNLGRTYLAPLVLGATMFVGGCGKEESAITLPVQQDTLNKVQVVQKQRENKLSDLINQYQRSAEEANTLFNESLQDGKLTQKEQNSIYEMLGKADQKRDKVFSYAGDLGKSIESRVKNESADRLYDLLEKNLIGVDYGAPELEKSLRKQDLSVYVERVDTKFELFEVMGILLGLGIIGIIVYSGIKGE